MERRRVREAVEEHRAAAQRAIACVTLATVSVRRPSVKAPHLRPVVLNNGQPAVIDGRLMIEVTHIIDTHALVGSASDQHATFITSYDYTLSHRSGVEIVSYQWHPGTSGSVAFPHVHFGPASARPDSAVRPGELHKVHFPTGIVTLRDVIRLAITEFGVEPRRSDWAAILGQDA